MKYITCRKGMNISTWILFKHITIKYHNMMSVNEKIYTVHIPFSISVEILCIPSIAIASITLKCTR